MCTRERKTSEHPTSRLSWTRSNGRGMARWGRAYRVLGGQTEAIAACASYSFCSIALTLANKAIFSEAALNFPWTMLLLQSAFVALLLLAFATAPRPGGAQPPPPIRRALLRQLALPCTFFTLFIFSNARALRHVSLPVLTVLKSLAPLCVALTERVLFGDALTAGTCVAMTLIVAGNVVTAAADGAFHAAGYAWALFNIGVNVAYVVSLRVCLSSDYSSAQKTLHSNILAVAFIAPMAVASAELPGFAEEFVLTSTRFRLLFLFSCLLAAGIGASVFWVMSAASGSTLSFVGATNKVVVVILGALFFDAKVSASGWAGVALGISAGGCFAVSKSLGKLQEKGKGKVKAKFKTELVEEQHILIDQGEDEELDLRK